MILVVHVTVDITRLVWYTRVMSYSDRTIHDIPKWSRKVDFDEEKFIVPPEPQEPELPKKPRQLEMQERQWEAEKDDQFHRQYWGEFCSDCGTLIGKDYGSMAHNCDEKILRMKYYRPLYEYQAEYREWERQAKLARVGNWLLESGYTLEQAYHIVSRPTVDDLEQILSSIFNKGKEADA